MESFDDIQKKEGEHLQGEIGSLGRRLVELGWSRDQVVAYVTQLFNEPADSASGYLNSDRKEG